MISEDGIDILQILERSVSEIKMLRLTAESQKGFIENITVRLAVHQIRHGTIDYEKCDAETWGKILRLIQTGKLCVASAGDCYLRMRLLTKEALDLENV